ncbi:MAG: YkgJ family cysteine cluster protein [Thermodesulfovibrionales bacterium]|nr:YkgJ family cysteine cluster protein [Thermodesulfovibrionales bacterium]
MLDDLFSKYENIARKADFLFKTIQEKYPLSVTCHIRCCDCCYAVFGVFPIEAAYINYYFKRLERKIRRDILRRAEKAETEMLKAKDTLKTFEENPKMQVYGLGKQRVRCPFLTDRDECIFYEKRPIICRIYGVPYSLKDGKKENSYVCSVSGFQEKVAYPTVKLDKLYNELVELSKELMAEGGTPIAKLNKANFMLPLSKVLRMPFEEIIEGEFGE